MDDTKILLNNNTNNEEKCKAANNIIINYELPLNIEQILLAHKKTREWIYKIKNNPDKNNRIFLFNTVLNINKNMYIAIILALCDNFNPKDLFYFILFKNGVCDKPTYIGLNNLCGFPAIKKYCELLLYSEFDVTNMQSISEQNKQEIQTYRAKIYSGKLTKRAIKNE